METKFGRLCVFGVAARCWSVSVCPRMPGLRTHVARGLSGLVRWPLSSTAPRRASITPTQACHKGKGSSTFRAGERHHSPPFRAPKRHHSPPRCGRLRDSQQTVRAKRGALEPPPFFLGSRIHSGPALGSTPEEEQPPAQGTAHEATREAAEHQLGVYRSTPPIPGRHGPRGSARTAQEPPKDLGPGNLHQSPRLQTPPS